MAPVNPSAGQVVGQKVRLIALLGRGGMGSVWRARHEGLGIDVAVKFIASDLRESNNPTVLARFSREAKLAARLDDPHIVRVMDHGVSDYGPYIVMELLRGESLAELLARRGRLDPDEVVETVSQIAAALEHAHENDVVHRDIKPANVFLTAPAKPGAPPLVKLLDFGIAKSDKLLEEVGSATSTGGLVGTPQYMSPEQLMRAQGVSKSSDLWALAVVAYEALTGRLPFQGETLAGTLVAITRADLLPPSSSVPGLAPDLDRFFKRALAAEESYRPKTATELAEALADAAAGSSPASTRIDQAPALMADLPTGEFLALQQSSKASSSPDPEAQFAPTQLVDLRALPVAETKRVATPRPSTGTARRVGAGVVGALAMLGGYLVLARPDPPPPPSSDQQAATPREVRDEGSVGVPTSASAAAPLEPPKRVLLEQVPLTTIPEGTGTLAASFLATYDVAREPGDENADFLGAQRACGRKQMSLCTEPQWLRACELHPVLATRPSWTLTGDRDGVMVRGGSACTDKQIVSAATRAPDRVGVCCTRVIGMRSSANPSPVFLKSTGAQILQVERLINASNGRELGRVSAPEVNFFGKRYDRDQLAETIGWYGRDSSNFFGHCNVDLRVTPVSKGFLAECEGLQLGGKSIVAFSRSVRFTEGLLDELRELRRPEAVPASAPDTSTDGSANPGRP
jgi:eukaryotic-like serine/threonine-protein kinase